MFLFVRVVWVYGTIVFMMHEIRQSSKENGIHYGMAYNQEGKQGKGKQELKGRNKEDGIFCIMGRGCFASLFSTYLNHGITGLHGRKGMGFLGSFVSFCYGSGFLFSSSYTLLCLSIGFGSSGLVWEYAIVWIGMVGDFGSRTTT